jgi:hypothetical protein
MMQEHDITGLLARYRAMVGAGEEERTTIINIINQLAEVNISSKECIFSRGVIKIKGNTVEAGQIFMHKENILRKIQDSIGKKYSDIRVV